MPDGINVPESVAGAPGTLRLNGRTFLVGQATHADLMAVRRRLKKAIKPPLEMYGRLASDPHFELLPEDVRRELAREAAQLTMRGEVALSAEMAMELLTEPEHCRFLAWVLLRKCHPDLRLDELTPLVTEDNAAAVCVELARESGLEALAGGGGGN